MTETEFEAAEKKRKLKKTLFALAMGGVVGFLGAMAVMRVLESERFASGGASVEVASLVGMIYLVTGLFVGLGALVPNAGAKVLNVEDADELREQRAMLLYSSIGMVVAAIALIVVAHGGAAGAINPDVALGVYIVTSIIAVAVSLKSRRHSDELMRAVSTETASMSFYLLALIGGTWAVLAHLQYVTAPTPLDWLTMFWSLMLLAAFIVTAKRGMMAMR
ncbi:hypothetical protein [Aurantiacibacter sp. D1-12]|uniref:hypothetical protein n=1 Tax=Aurantiacibacter sp. D1-12 TaxID=2993658 RepID=UPI00237CDABA|nr:hypothetical protein [Aurantiacibacter sp. D1-12]MDE1466981.1 hypothetical protein [Aurantiacibacter sp. D1-12]